MQNTTRTPLLMATTGCACCTPAAESTAPTQGQAPGVTGAPTPAGASTYPVEGMTCGHCAGSVMDAITALPGAEDVRVDLVSGGVSAVTVTGPAAPAAVRAAIEESGYTPAS